MPLSTGNTCSLCGLDLPRRPVLHSDLGPDKPFCCEGCATVYRVAQESGQLEQVLASPPGRRPALGGLLAPGENAYFVLSGMWCSGCAVAAQRILEHQPGIVAAEVSFASERGRLRYDPERTDAEAALLSLEGLGYRATLVSDAADDREERRENRILWQFFIALGLGMNVMGFYLNQLYHYYARGDLSLPMARSLQYLVWCLATPVLLLGGISFPRGAWRALRARTATMDTLVTLAIYAAYGYSAYMTVTGQGQTYFDSVVMIVTFVTLGRYLEALGSGRARKDMRRLLRLQPPSARRRRGDSWEEVPARALSAGDTILVKPGERVPADGEVLEGEGALEEALLTGESTPILKGPGDTVYAGTLLADAALTCQVSRPPGRTRLAQITELVERTLASKPPVQRLADQASAWLAVGVLAAAVLTALGWWATGHALAPTLLAAVAVLVVACPCALGLATPLALTVVLGRAAQAGILVRNPAALEMAAGVQRIVLDKTGTLTRGRLAVVAVTPAPGQALSADGLLLRAAAVEQYSEHPVARAIAAACPTAPPAASGFKAVRGLGASAVVTPYPSPHGGESGSLAARSSVPAPFPHDGGVTPYRSPDRGESSTQEGPAATAASDTVAEKTQFAPELGKGSKGHFPSEANRASPQEPIADVTTQLPPDGGTVGGRLPGEGEDALSREPAEAEVAPFPLTGGMVGGLLPHGGAAGGEFIRVGSLRFLDAEPDPALQAEAEARAAHGETVVWVGCEGAAAGLIALRDEPNPTAEGALRRLAGLGVKAVMLSGDDPRTVAAIAGELGVAEHEGHCAPADKAARIAAWQAAGERVAMVGDGVNDAPALAQADISITAAGGADVAGAVSDVVLTSRDLGLLAELIALSRRTRRIIRLNLGWALAYNLVTVPLAAVGAISPAIAAATMAASSLLVVGNSLRLRAGNWAAPR